MGELRKFAFCCLFLFHYIPNLTKCKEGSDTFYFVFQTRLQFEDKFVIIIDDRFFEVME